MAVAIAGSAGISRSTTATAAGVQGQPPTAGNLLVCLLGWGGTTSSTTASSMHTGTTGWTKVLADIRDNGNLAGVAVWAKVAAGGDAAPSFDIGVAGTLACSADIYELSGADTSNINALFDTTGPFQSANGVSLASVSATTAAAVAAAGGMGLFIGARERAANTYTLTPGTGWVQDDNDGATSSVYHYSSQHQVAPATGATLTGTVSFSGTTASSHGAAYVLVVKPAAAAVTGLLPQQLRGRHAAAGGRRPVPAALVR